MIRLQVIKTARVPVHYALTKRRFYSKDGNDLKYIDAVEYNVRQYSFHELVRMISKAGWTLLGAYDHLRTLQTFTPKS